MGKKIEKVKQHFTDNKKLYIGVGIGVVVTTVVVVMFPDKGIQIVDAFKVQVNSPTTNNVIQTNLARRGHPGNLILCNETGEVFASQNRAAELLGLSASNLSRHLKGDLAHTKGYTFTNLGEAA